MAIAGEQFGDEEQAVGNRARKVRILQKHAVYAAMVDRVDQGIDSGPIVARRHYPPPPGIDVDLVYDSVIRADLLVRVLRDFAETREWPRIEDTGSGTTYYVIHPVLKHLALLSNEAHV